MPSFLEREQLVPVAPSIAPADQILGAFGTKLSLFGMGQAQAMSAYNNYGSMSLTNPQNQQQHDQLMQTAGQELKSATMKDLSVGDNQSAALSVFDPILKDQDIMGDHALTQAWGQSRAQGESARISNGGKGYNPDALRAVNAQQQLYARSDKSTWRTFYNNKESYNPYMDESAEMQKMAKTFKTDVIEKDSQNGAYITTTKDSSWYKDKWQAYVEANASPQLKAQIAQRARADYYTDMLTMPKEAMVQKYTDLRNGLIKKQMYVDSQNIMNIGAQLALKHDSKDNGLIRTQLMTQAAYLNDAYDAKKTALNSPLENADAIGTVEGLATGTRLAEGLAQYKYFDKIGDAFAHKEEKFTIKPDLAYLTLTKIKEQSREFGIRQAEVSRHNKADEGIGQFNAQAHMLTAQAAMISAQKKKDADGSDVDDGGDSMTNQSGSTGGNGDIHPDNHVNPASDTPEVLTQGKTILDNLGNVKKQYDAVTDDVVKSIFHENVMGQIDRLLADPHRQNFTLRDVPDPSKATDGTGGDISNLAKFIVASGALMSVDPSNMWKHGPTLYNSTDGVYDMKLADVKPLLHKIFSDPAMLKTGLDAIKSNNSSVDSYGVATELDIRKQRIDAEHSEILSQAMPFLKTNLGPYAALFNDKYLSKGIIPTVDDVRSELNNLPDSMLRQGFHDMSTGEKNMYNLKAAFTDPAKLIKDNMADKITNIIYGTLGNNRTAYNTLVGNYEPKKGNGVSDTKFTNRLMYLVDNAETGTKGTGGGKVNDVLEYAKRFPALVSRVNVHSADEAHDKPYFQMWFKSPTTEEEKQLKQPESGVSILSTGIGSKYTTVPMDDRTQLLNNKGLKYQVSYNDGTKSKLSIYNSTGDQSNPKFEINPDFSYKALDFDRTTGDIRGVQTFYRDDIASILTKGRPDMLSKFTLEDPTEVYNMVAKTMHVNADIVNYFHNHKIDNIRDLPQFLKNQLTVQ